MVRYAYNMALVFRHRVRIDPLISKWFRILDEADLVPDEYRASGVRSYRQVSQGASRAGTRRGDPTSSCSIPPGSRCSSARPG